MNFRKLRRRDVLKALSLGLGAAALPRFAFANTPGDARFVLAILRGAVDGLALCPPFGDRAYRGVRGELAIDPPGSNDGVLKLDGLFGLHPALTGVHEAYLQSEAALLHAVASPYRERSHFDGQDLLESGADRVGGMRDGWLNRAIAGLGGSLGAESAIAMGQTTPLVLRGNESVATWAPSRLAAADEDTLTRLLDLYSEDAFFSARLDQALRSQDIAAGLPMTQQSGRRGNQALGASMSHASRFLTAVDGPRIAVVEAGGWDTHANQGGANGQLANRLRDLDSALGDLRTGLGDAWEDTVVAVVTEFGRTVRVNGTKGTDHGTGTAALFLGGAVNGGKVVADWPGLGNRDLYEARDLAPTTDLRSPLKSVLIEHLGLDAAFVNSAVFPGSQFARPLDGLIRTTA